MNKDTEIIENPEDINQELENSMEIIQWTQGGDDSVKPVEESSSGFWEILSFLRDIVIIIILALSIRTFIASPFQIKGQSMENSYHDGEYILVDRFSYLQTNKLQTYPYNTNITDKLTNVFTNFYNYTFAKLPVHIGDPKRWDVVVITPHVDIQKQYYIKRVIGTPGDAIKIENGKVFLRPSENNGSWEFIELQEDYLSETNKNGTYLPPSMWEEVKEEFIIPEGKYWVMGDNRQNSADSRSCFRSCSIQNSEHYIKRGDILGRVLLDFWYVQIFKKDENGFHIQKPTIVYPPRWLNHPKKWSYPEILKN